MPMPRSLAGTNTFFAESNIVRLPMTMRPACGRSSPAMQRSVVVLPQPEGPSSVMSLPVSTARLTPSTARTSAPEAMNDLCRFSIANMGQPAAGALAAPIRVRRCTRVSKKRRPATMTSSGAICNMPSAATAP
jgi:hypothetical protein